MKIPSAGCLVQISITGTLGCDALLDATPFLVGLVEMEIIVGGVTMTLDDSLTLNF